MAWIGAAIAGAIAAAIGLIVAISPDLWLGLFTAGPDAPASQGTGEMMCPVAANLSRITIALCGSLLALDVLAWGTPGLFGFVALGIVSFSAMLAFSTTRRVWTR